MLTSIENDDQLFITWFSTTCFPNLLVISAGWMVYLLFDIC